MKINFQEELIIAKKELAFQNSDKEKRDVELTASNVKVHETEIRLNKANRLYSFISYINKTILRTKDEQTLFDEVCRIAVEIGNFKMAWIGIADTSKRKIKLLASNGSTEEDIRLLSDKTYHSDGLTDKILHGAEYYAVPNIQAEDIIRWQNYAAARGFISAVSLPIKKSGKVIGTFDMYSSETNFFNDAEIEMLREVAEDISFAVDLFEKEKIHQDTVRLVFENENRFRALIEKSSDMKTLTNREGKVLYSSPSIEKRLGYTAEEYLHKYPLDIIHPDDLEKYFENRSRLLQTPGKSFDFEQRRLHKNNSWIWCEGTVTNFIDEPGINALVSNFRDITERKKAEEDIKRSENRFRALIEKGTEMKTLSTLEGEMIYCSPAITEVLGYSQEEFLHTSGLNLIHPDDITGYKEKRNGIVDFPGKSFTNQNRFLHKNGNWIWCEGTVTNMLHEPGINAFVSNFANISEKKRIEVQREFDNNNLIALINNTADLMWSVDRNFNLITSNSPFDKMSKISFGKVIPKGGNVLSAAYTPEMLTHFKQQYERAFTGETFTETEHFDFPVEVWTEISYYPIRKDDEIIGTACHSRDITENKNSEVKLFNSEKKYRNMVETSHDLIWAVDAEGIITYMNKASRKIYGYEPEELIGTSYLDLMSEEERILQAEALPKLLASGDKYSIGTETEVQDKLGNRHTLYANAVVLYDDHGKAIGSMGTSTDITERKKAEKKLLQSEARLKEAQALSHSSNWEVDLLNGNSIWSDEFYNIFGIKFGDVKPSPEAFLSFIHPEDRKFAQQKVQGAFETFESSFFNFRFLANDGKIKNGYTEWRFEFDKEKNPVRLFGILQDVTEQTLTEEKIKQSESNLKLAQSIAHIGSWQLDFSNNALTLSEEGCRIFGFPEEENQLSGEKWMALVHHEDIDGVMLKIKASQETLQDTFYDHRIILKDGTIKYIHSESKFELDANGKPIGMNGTMQDITERRLAEEEIQKLATIVQRSPEFIGIAGLDAKTIYLNNGGKTLIGLNREITTTTMFDFFAPVDLELFQTEVIPTIEKKGRWKGDINLRNFQTGQLIPVLMDIFYVLNPLTQKPIAFATVSADITELKRKEETSLQLASIVESSRDAIVGMSLDGLIVSWNHAAKILYEYSSEEVIGKSYATLLNLDKAEEFSKNIEKMKVGEQLGHFESEHFKKDGTLIYVILSVSPIHDATGKLTGMSINGHDISEQKRAELVLNKTTYKEKGKLKRKLIVELAIGLILSLIFYFLSVTFSLPQKLFDVIGNPENSILDDLVLVMSFLFILAVAFGFRRATVVQQGGQVIQNALRALTKELEMRVQERTNDFSKSNDILREEIGERQKAEQKLEHQNNELLKTNTELDRFVYSTSHDLRAPLTSLLGLIDIVSENPVPAESLQHEQLQMMKQSVLKLNNFIEDILHYSRNSRTNVANEEINFEETIQEIRGNHKFMEGAKEINLKVEIKQEVKFVSDRGRVNVVLNNLISNAIKYQDASKENPFLKIFIRCTKEIAIIEIEDNGIGIAAKDNKKIFEMFYRATKNSAGSGLGLYIAKETIEKLGGTITLESELNKGTKFTISIPNQIATLN